MGRKRGRNKREEQSKNEREARGKRSKSNFVSSSWGEGSFKANVNMITSMDHHHHPPPPIYKDKCRANRKEKKKHASIKITEKLQMDVHFSISLSSVSFFLLLFPFFNFLLTTCQLKSYKLPEIHNTKKQQLSKDQTMMKKKWK